MKPVIIILAILIFAACLALGIFAGDLSIGWGSPSGESAAQITPTYTANNQQNIAFIQVDDLLAAQPRLLGVWLVLYNPERPHLVTLLLYPAAEGAPGSRLGEDFGLKDGRPSDAFIKEVGEDGLPFNGYLMVDLTAAERGIDWLGGIETSDSSGVLDGRGAVAQAQNGDPAAGGWRGLVGGVCARVSTLNAQSNWSALMTSLMPEHLRTDLSLERSLQDWQKLTAGNDGLSCELVVQSAGGQ